ncbi:monocarboxylate transporter 5-like [Lytechinus variegatus]|uniref:monocarboxylate transporter 5-like n=1 Tax=Lytechinus variegatus TaxID=7654 RepID=UPI001BB0F183|nr:monocarboxylate transporter 5-like [Lytechinus variegatus]
MEICSIFQNRKSLKSTPVLFLQTCYLLGTIKAIGVCLPDMERNLNLNRTSAGLALGLFDALAFGPGPAVTYLYQRLNGNQRRYLVMAGAILAAGGLLLVSTVTNCVELALCLSIAGMGSNIISISMVITLSSQSGDAFGVFYGIGKSGYAFGMALVPLLADYLMGIYGWRGSLLIIGGIMANLIPLALMVDFEEVEDEMVGHRIPHSPDRMTEELLGTIDEESTCGDSSKQTVLLHQLGKSALARSIYTNVRSSSDNIRDESTASNAQEDINEETHGETSLMLESRSRRHIKKTGDKPWSGLPIIGRIDGSKLYVDGCQIFTNSIYNQDRWMILLMLVTLVYATMNGGWYSFLIPRAVALGIPTSKALCVAYSAATAAFIGRCFSGVILKYIPIPGRSSFIFLTFLNIASLLVDISGSNFAVTVVTSFITSLTIAERNILVLVICKDRAPLSEFPVILASSEIAFGVGAFLGSSLTGYVADATGSFNASFMFIAAVDTMVFLLIIPLIIAER